MAESHTTTFAAKAATMLAPEDLKSFGIPQLHALYDAFEQAAAVFLGISNQPRIGDTSAADLLEKETLRLSDGCRAIVGEMCRRERPADAPGFRWDKNMWAEVILRDALVEPPEPLILAAQFIAAGEDFTVTKLA